MIEVVPTTRSFISTQLTHFHVVLLNALSSFYWLYRNFEICAELFY